MFPVKIPFDAFPASKVKANPELKSTLQVLFEKHGRNYKESYFLVAINNKTKTIRSSTYVLSEGMITSSLCFSFSQFKSVKSIWITPHGWKTASIVCSIIFTGECCILDEKMQFRFAKVDLSTGDEIKGDWKTNVQSAFACLNSFFPRKVKSNLSKISKQVILAIHTQRVQDAVWKSWNNSKSQLSPEELTVAKDYERLFPLSLPRPDFDPNGIISAIQIASLFSQVHQLREIKEVLCFLDAGLGVRMQYFLEFWELVEVNALKLWQALRAHASLPPILCQLLGWEWHDGACHTAYLQSLLQQPDKLLELNTRAVIFVFLKLSQRFPNADILQRNLQVEFPKFLSKLTLLPNAKMARELHGLRFCEESE